MPIEPIGYMKTKKEKVALSSVFASAGLTGTKLVAGLLTGSIGILSEAAHSALDLGAAIITFLAVRVSDKPADEDHHYGHGKIESISALIETGLLFITSAWIIYEAIHRILFKSVEVEVTWYAFVVIILSIIVDISRSRALSKVAKETNSQALEADALHFHSDIYSSGVVLLGLILISFGIRGADGVAALGVAFFVLRAGWQLGKRTFDVLTDTAPLGMMEKVKEISEAIDGVASVERVRIRPVGVVMFIELIVNISRVLPVEQMNKIVSLIKKKIIAEIPEADVATHINPIALKNENIIERIHAIVGNHGLEAHNVEIYHSNSGKTINLDLEINDNLSLEEAHAKSDHIEKSIAYEMGSDIKVYVHLDPAIPHILRTIEVPEEEKKQIMSIIEEERKQFSQIQDIHNVDIQRKDDGVILISYHCVLEKQMAFSDAHRLSHDMKSNIRKILGDKTQIVIHVEPEKCVD